MGNMRKDLFPVGLKELRDNFCTEYQKTRKVSNGRVFCIKAHINAFYEFLNTKGITDLNKLNSTHFIQHQYYLYRTRGISSFAVSRNIETIKLFYRALFYKNLISTNPSTTIRLIDPPNLEVDKITRYYNLAELKILWANYLRKEINCSYTTVKRKLLALDLFFEYLQKKGIKTIYKVRVDSIEEYKEYLKQYKDKQGKGFNPYMQVFKLRCMCQFFVFLKRRRMIKQNPSDHIRFKQYFRELTSQMPKREHPKRFKPPIIPLELSTLLGKFRDYFMAGGGSSGTIHNYLREITRFWQYLTDRGITDLRKVTKTIVMDYQTYLYNTISPNTNDKYSPNTILNNMIAIRSFFRFLVKYDYLQCDPTSTLDLPKSNSGLPHSYMTEREVKLILDQPDLSTPMGIRDRAILEALYSTGVRVNELIHIEMSHVDITNGLVRIEHPKGGRSYQRVIPIGKVATHYIQQYLLKVRPYIKNHLSKEYLFLSLTGNRMEKGRVLDIVKRCLYKSGLRKRISTHSFRVTCATHMLKNDADIRYVQEQLGHKSIRTTQGYTRLVPKDLKAVHSRCHPREKISFAVT